MWLSRGEQPREQNDGTWEIMTKKKVGVKRLSSSLLNRKGPDAPVSFRAGGGVASPTLFSPLAHHVGVDHARHPFRPLVKIMCLVALVCFGFVVFLVLWFFFLVFLLVVFCSFSSFCSCSSTSRAIKKRKLSRIHCLAMELSKVVRQIFLLRTGLTGRYRAHYLYEYCLNCFRLLEL